MSLGACGLRLVGASAGSGKTYRLTREVTAGVAPESGVPLALEGLVGVTYTTKAHAELEARIRRVLVENRAFDRAQELPLAYVGTVHSVALRIVKEFALDAGLSPTVDVIPGNEGRRLLQDALEHALDGETRLRIQELASRFELEWLPQFNRTDWIAPVEDIMTLARGNRIAPERLPDMARRSIEGLISLLRPPVPDGADLERTLTLELRRAIEALGNSDDETKVTREALRDLRSAAADLQRKNLGWTTWARLSRLNASKRASELLAPLKEAASAYEIHPLFRAELVELTERIFDAARVGLVAYAEWKAERGLVDYVDMIDRALDVLAVPEVEDELRERLSLVVVDEFQDTSPIQLALFMRLHGLAGRSLWVGDRKQCIFEYAGADPALMDAVTRWVRDNGGENETLRKNYRSRPELVRACSHVFSAAFARHGYTHEEVACEPERSAASELAALPPLGLWWLEGEQDVALAKGVVGLLRDAEATPVVDRSTGEARPLRPNDLAVLVYSNAEAARVSAALAACGVASVLPRAGLLSTPEGTLVRAALRFLADRYDTLAEAEVEALTAFDGHSPDADEADAERPFELWLAQKIEAQLLRDAAPSELAAREALPANVPKNPAVAKLEVLRGELKILAPAETLDRVLGVLDLPALAVRWDDSQQRLSNLEALRALAAAYEERCSYQREAASLGGLLRYFDETEQKIRQRDEHRATDEQHVGGSDNAIVISTYHKAKGLEWPVVVLGSLHRKRSRDVFEVTPESDREAFDATDPLGGRWIRYWPRPLGRQSAAPLMERATDSATGRAVAERDARERVRLLYVGCTRARDHLIFAVQQLKRGPSHAWLDELRDDAGALLTLPDPAAGLAQIGIRGRAGERLDMPARVWTLDGNETPDSGSQESPETRESLPRYWFAPATDHPSLAPLYWIAPSAAATADLELPPARVTECLRFTRRMPFVTPTGTTFDQVGDALHAFLAADRPELTADDRATLATGIFERAGLASFFDPHAAIAASDALRAFVAERWPGAVWHTEIPISALIDTPHGRRRIAGSIDLMLETPSGVVIIDHKSFPGRASEWEARALSYAPQLMTYAKAVRLAGRTVLGTFVHFLIGGGIVEVQEGMAG